jgi:hypothetical protein
VTGRADGWIRWTTIGCVTRLALIAGTVSYLHMHMLVARYGQPGWVAALTPLSVDGMILAASTTLLADSQVLILVEWEFRAAFDSYRHDPALADLHPHRERGSSAYVWHLFDRLDDLRPLLRP